MSQVQRYSKIIRGKFIFTGNTIGFSSGNSGFGLGAFLSTTTGLSVSGFPTPSTSDWTKNGSTATLSIPASHYVEYAELVWTGSSIGVASPAININAPVTFITPLGTNTISPDTITSQSSSGFSQTFYTRSQDVTTLVRASLSGTYTVNGVPATLEPTTSGTSCGGWSLCVVASHISLPYQSLTFYISSIISSSTPVDTTFSGFITPFTGSFSSRVLITACEGNSAILNDYCKLGPNSGSLTSLFGPNNSATNFFQSQINNGNSFSPTVGQLDTTGSFGNLNQTPGSQVKGVRSGFDITNVPGAPLPNSISSAVLSIGTSGDAYAVSSFALHIDVNNAALSLSKSVDKLFAKVGENLTYTFTLTNSGNYSATGIFFNDTIPDSTSFVNSSFTIGGVSYPSITPASFPVSIPNIPVGTSSTITFKVTVDTFPSLSNITNSSTLTYTPLFGSFEVETIPSNIVSTTILDINLNTQKFVDKSLTTLGFSLTYSVNITNDGKTDLINVFFLDTISNYTTFIPNSVYIDSIPTPSLTPFPPGIFLGTLPSGMTHTISFSVDVSSIPNDYLIKNAGEIHYDHVGNSQGVLVKDTNTVSSTLLISTLSLAKDISSQYSTCGEVITYTFSIENTGNTSAIKIFFIDTLPSSLTFVDDSVKFNSVSQIGLNPSPGFLLPDILENTTFTLTFDAIVNCS